MFMRSKFAAFLRLLRRFGKSEAGMTLPLLALSMMTMSGLVGMAIDTARLQLVQSKLQFSLDAAGLAAGSTVNTANLDAEVTKYMNANFNGYLGATLTNVDASADETKTLINLTAEAELPTTFMKIFNIDKMKVDADSEISRAVTGLELVLVLDVTGSMAETAGGGGTKIAALKTASTTLINTLFGSSAEAPENLYVGIVPFSQAVNIGTSHTGWLSTQPSDYDWGPSPSEWAGCVDARINGEDVTDSPPTGGDTLYRPYYWTSDNLNPTPNSGNNDWKLYHREQKEYRRCKNGNCSNVHPTCSTSNGWSCEYLGWTWHDIVASCTENPNHTHCNPDGVFAYTSPLNTTDRGPNLYCPQEVTRMTTSKTTLLAAINALQPDGNTLVNQGMHWGWNMISPRWRGYWGGTMGSSLPLDYGTHGMNKAVVLLTDGDNTQSNSAHSAYWFLNDNLLGTTSSSTAVTTLNTRTQQLCTAMKNKGIYVYTIALGATLNSTSLTMLRNCATATNYAFVSPTTSQLESVFQAIGDSLANLRVSQ